MGCVEQGQVGCREGRRVGPQVGPRQREGGRPRRKAGVPDGVRPGSERGLADDGMRTTVMMNQR